MSDNTDTPDSDAQPMTDDLATLVREQRETIAQQQQLIDDLTDRVEELEDSATDATDVEERVTSLERTVDIKHDRHLSWLDELIVGDESGLSHGRARGVPR